MRGKKRHIKLKKKSRKALEIGRKNGKAATFRQRCHYILLSDQGKTVNEIADIYQVGRNTITGWFNRYESEGIEGLNTAKGRGRPAIVRIDNEPEVSKIEEWVEQNAQNLKPVLSRIEKELGKKMSKQTLQRLLKKKGWDWKRFRGITPQQPDEAEYEEKCKQLKTLMMLFVLGCIDLRFTDETAFTLQPNMPYGWIRKGQQEGIPVRKGGNLNVFGLLNLIGHLTTYQTKQNVNSQTVIEWLDDFASKIKQVTVIVMDNAPWHVSGQIKKKIKEWEKLGLIIFYLPPYSPHLNPIEILWRKMKMEWLKPKDYESKETLHDAVNNILGNYDKDPFKINFDIAKRC